MTQFQELLLMFSEWVAEQPDDERAAMYVVFRHPRADGSVQPVIMPIPHEMVSDAA